MPSHHPRSQFVLIPWAVVVFVALVASALQPPPVSGPFDERSASTESVISRDCDDPHAPAFSPTTTLKTIVTALEVEPAHPPSRTHACVESQVELRHGRRNSAVRGRAPPAWQSA